MLIDYNKFRSSKLNSTPFDHMVVENFIHPQHIPKICKDFPETNSYGSLPLTTLNYNKNFTALIDEINSKNFREIVEEKFSITLKNNPVMITIRGMCKESNGKIHIDSKGKIITFLLYFNQEWTNQGGRLRLLNDGKNIENYFAEVPPLAGTLIAFRCTKNAWHGHTPFQGKRRAIQINWVKDQNYLKKEQRRHKISAFLKRLKNTIIA